MRTLRVAVSNALVLAALLCGVAATPAFADRDHHDRWRHEGRHYSHHGEWDRPRTSFYWYPYSHYYYRPRAEYYAAPDVYVPPPPAPSSFGLNLVFPIH